MFLDLGLGRAKKAAATATTWTFTASNDGQTSPVSITMNMPIGSTVTIDNVDYAGTGESQYVWLGEVADGYTFDVVQNPGGCLTYFEYDTLNVGIVDHIPDLSDNIDMVRFVIGAKESSTTTYDGGIITINTNIEFEPYYNYGVKISIQSLPAIEADKIIQACVDGGSTNTHPTKDLELKIWNSEGRTSASDANVATLESRGWTIDIS